MEKIIYDLWLNELKGIGTRSYTYLLEAFGTSENIYHATYDELLGLSGVIRKKSLDAINTDKDLSEAKKIFKEANDKNISMTSLSQGDYPQNLRDIYDPPLVLYYIGDLSKITSKAIGIVGARKASPYGKYVSFEFGKTFGESGISVISGMAYGIDTQAHKGALEANGFTVAVLGCGVDICYPKANKKLKENMEKTGLIISEYKPGTAPIATNFPSRNRIISGLSQGVIVIEAAIKSGTLITTEFALEQGKDVYVVPGNINNINSEGTNKLLKEGAIPIISIDDLKEEFGIKNRNNNIEINLEEDEEKLLDIIKNIQPATIDKILQYSLKSVPEINGLLTILEIKGLIEVFPGKIIIAK